MIIDSSLFQLAEKLNQGIKRNIVYVSAPKDAFASLIDNEGELEVINQASKYARQSIARCKDIDNFYYTAAIEYPFKTEPFMCSRFSDGTFPIWYGAKTITTTIHETAYHTFKYLYAIDDIENEKIIRKRRVFDVFCDAICVSLLGKEKIFPELVTDDYSFTQQIGREIKKGGYPGVISPSVRHKNGENINIFKKDALSEPQLEIDLAYEINLKEKQILVKGLEKDLVILYQV